MASSKNSSSFWTSREKMLFEHAVVIYGKAIVEDRWEIVAKFVGKSVEEVKQHYQDLVEVAKATVAGRVPPLPYKDDKYSKPETGLNPLPEHKDSSTSETSPNLEEEKIAESSKVMSRDTLSISSLKEEGEEGESSTVSKTPVEEKK